MNSAYIFNLYIKATLSGSHVWPVYTGLTVVINYLHVYLWALRLYHPRALLYTRGHWDCTTLRHFCIPVGIEIVPPQALLYTCGHWDCTTLKHFCIAWGEGCTGVLKGGTISMPTSRHVDNDFIPGLRTKKSYILSGFSCSSCNVIVTFLYLWTKIP
jgi:hypothetical protein